MKRCNDKQATTRTNNTVASSIVSLQKTSVNQVLCKHLKQKQRPQGQQL